MGTAAGGASGGSGGGGSGGSNVGGAVKGAVVASGKALFRGAASAISRATAPIADNFTLGLKAGRIDAEGAESATAPAWAASAREDLRTQRAYP